MKPYSNSDIKPVYSNPYKDEVKPKGRTDNSRGYTPQIDTKRKVLNLRCIMDVNTSWVSIKKKNYEKFLPLSGISVNSTMKGATVYLCPTDYAPLLDKVSSEGYTVVLDSVINPDRFADCRWFEPFSIS
jgi:hypothetical protein